MLQFFLRVLKIYVNSVAKFDLQVFRAWEQLKDLKPSRYDFEVIFSKKELRGCLTEMFKSRFLFREIISSGIKMDLKRCYVKYHDVMK